VQEAVVDFIPILIVILVVALFVFILRSSARSRREKLAAQQKRASALGFRPLKQAPPELTARINQLRLSSQGRQLRLEQVYHRADFDQDFYLVDVVDGGDDQGDWLGPETLVVISPNLALPRFTLVSLPQINEGGIAAEYAGKLLDSAFSWMAGTLGMERIKISSSAGFENRYVVFGRSQAAVQHLFSPSLTDYLMGVNLPLTVEGEGDLFAAGLSYTSSRERENQLQDLYREVIDLARVLKRGE
jgi:hypothetical protein